MYALKDKVSDKLSRLFPESSSPTINRQTQARSYSNGVKSITSYISNFIPSRGFNGGEPDKAQHEFKLIPSEPVRFNKRSSKTEDEFSNGYEAGNVANGKKQTQTNDDVVADVLEEAIRNHIPSSNSMSNVVDESAFITVDLYEFLFSSIPNIVKGCQWVLLYSTLRDGISLRTLIRKSADLSGPCLLIVGDKQGTIFGGLLDCPLKPTPKRKYQGTNQSFIFTTIYGEPRLFRPTGANRYYYLCVDDLLALGGGGNFALCLDGDLLHGTSGPCETFGNMCLAQKPEFELKNVELWGFTHKTQYPA